MSDGKTWVGVSANLTAPAVHLHDGTRVPMTRDVSPVDPRFGREAGGFAWTITYTCPQCHAVIVVDADVALDVDSKPRVDEVAWFHGKGPA